MPLIVMASNEPGGVDSGSRPSKICSLPQCRNLRKLIKYHCQNNPELIRLCTELLRELSRLILELYRLFRRPEKTHHSDRTVFRFCANISPIGQQAVYIQLYSIIGSPSPGPRRFQTSKQTSPSGTSSRNPLSRSHSRYRDSSLQAQCRQQPQISGVIIVSMRTR
jgi:hypothetical protein